MTTPRETLVDLGGSSSSEEEGHRLPMERKSPPPAEVRRRHPFSVEALMADRKTGSQFGRCERASPPVLPLALNYLCQERRTLPGASRKSVLAASPVKSEVSELVPGSEDCAPWLSKSAFSAQPREFPRTQLISPRIYCDSVTFQPSPTLQRLLCGMIVFEESFHVVHKSYHMCRLCK